MGIKVEILNFLEKLLDLIPNGKIIFNFQADNVKPKTTPWFAALFYLLIGIAEFFSDST